MKNFAEEGEAEQTKIAQKELNKIVKKNETFIPKIICWIDNLLLVSKKSDWCSVRQVLEETNKENIETNKKAFFSLWVTLGELHERTEKVITPEIIEENRTDRAKLIKHMNLFY